MISRRSLCAGVCALAITTALPAPPALTAEERQYMALVPSHLTAAQRAQFLAGLRDPNPSVRYCTRCIIEMTPAQLRSLLTWMERERAREETPG